MDTPSRIASALALALGGLVALGAAWAQGPAAQERPQAKVTPKSQAPGRGGLQGFPDLVKGLKETPGCLGVETARTSKGKNVIFAWFRDKKAVTKWYFSETHQKAMG